MLLEIIRVTFFHVANGLHFKEVFFIIVFIRSHPFLRTVLDNVTHMSRSNRSTPCRPRARGRAGLRINIYDVVRAILSKSSQVSRVDIVPELINMN